MNLLTYLMLTIVINYVCDCTIWGYYPLGIPAVLTAQYIILNKLYQSHAVGKLLKNNITITYILLYFA